MQEREKVTKLFEFLKEYNTIKNPLITEINNQMWNKWMVDSNEGEGPMRLTSYGTDNLYKKRYNVAVSRATDQLWVVYSMDVDNDLKVGDIRKELLNYCRNYESREIEYKKNSLKAESEFEKRVMQYPINQGYKIIPQWEVEAYRIDMVVVYKENKIAIECDGERWHREEKLK